MSNTLPDLPYEPNDLRASFIDDIERYADEARELAKAMRAHAQQFAYLQLSKLGVESLRALAATYSKSRLRREHAAFRRASLLMYDAQAEFNDQVDEVRNITYHLLPKTTQKDSSGVCESFASPISGTRARKRTCSDYA